MIGTGIFLFALALIPFFFGHFVSQNTSLTSTISGAFDVNSWSTIPVAVTTRIGYLLVLFGIILMVIAVVLGIYGAVAKPKKQRET